MQATSAVHHVDSPPSHGEVPGEVVEVEPEISDEVLAPLDRPSTSTGRKFVRRGPGGPTQFNRGQARQPSCANCGPKGHMANDCKAPADGGCGQETLLQVCQSWASECVDEVRGRPFVTC